MQMVMILPLSAMKANVKRVYFDGARQAANLQKWYEDFLVNPAVAVDVNGRFLVAGGPDGLKAFDQCWQNQMKLVLQQKMSGKCTCLVHIQVPARPLLHGTRFFAVYSRAALQHREQNLQLDVHA
jgi:hypothetical protein